LPPTRHETLAMMSMTAATLSSARQILNPEIGPGNWPEVASIYDEATATGNATVQTKLPS